jgi:hypothetical protein
MKTIAKARVTNKAVDNASAFLGMRRAALGCLSVIWNAFQDCFSRQNHSAILSGR